MDPLFGGLIAGGISAISGMFGTQQNNQNQQALLQQQEAYNTQMSNTAYQRARTDMVAAGLNPMMMAAGGMSASTPTAPSAAPQQSAAMQIGPSIDKAISTAVQMKNVDKMAEEIANMRTEEQKRIAETKTEAMRPPLLAQEAGKIRAETDLRKAALPVALNEALSAKNESDIDPTIRRLADQAGFAGRKVSDTLSPIGNIVSSARRALNAMGHGY